MAEARDPYSYEYFFHVIYRRDPDDKPAHDFARYLTEYLEKEMTDKLGKPIRGYYAERDAKLGSNTIKEIVRVIENSSFTLVVLTERFIESTWDMYWNLTAFQKRTKRGDKNLNQLIPIVFGVKDTKLQEIWKELELTEVLIVPETGYKDEETWQSRLADSLKPPSVVPYKTGQKETKKGESSRLVPSASVEKSPLEGQERQLPGSGTVDRPESKQPSSMRVSGKGTTEAASAACQQTEKQEEKNSEDQSFQENRCFAEVCKMMLLIYTL